jgi:hypothetical protein
MSTAMELIQIVERAGGRFDIVGDWLGITPARLIQPVKEELCQHKPEIIELLRRRPGMPAGVRLLRWEPTEAPVQLSQCSTVTDVDKFIRSTLRQVEARLNGKDWFAGNWTLSTLLDRLALCGCIVALDDPRKKLQ